MAVFTPVERDELDRWLLNYQIGEVIEFRGISAGIENSNFFVTTQQEGQSHPYVLTLFERLTPEQLPYYLELMRHLAERGVPCPAPLANREGALFGILNGKPAAFVSKLPGAWIREPDAGQCAAVGYALAHMHLAGQDFPRVQPNLRGLEWWQATVPTVLPFLNEELRALIQDELAYQSEHYPQMRASLPSGPIHADLFRDNALFQTLDIGTIRERSVLGGFIDFYFAGHDLWLFDVAVSVNDWCIDLASGALDMARASALLDAYASQRSFSAAEKLAWPAALRAAALRFWLSRLWDFYLPRPAQMLIPHDPTHFERVLRQRRSGGDALAKLLPQGTVADQAATQARLA